MVIIVDINMKVDNNTVANLLQKAIQVYKNHFFSRFKFN